MAHRYQKMSTHPMMTRNKQNKLGEQLMDAAAYNAVYHRMGNDPYTLPELLKMGADPNWVDSYHKRAPLQSAACWGYIDAVRLLLEAGANPNVLDNDGRSALQYAGWHRVNPEIVKMLIKAGADVNVRDRYAKLCGHTDNNPLVLFEHYPKIIKMLKKAGAQ